MSEVANSTDSVVVVPPAQQAEDPAWVSKRLEREYAKILRDLGVQSLDDAKAAVASAKAAEDAQKSAAQRLAELEVQLKNSNAESKNMADALGAYAKSQLDALTEPQRNAVLTVAGDNPSQQLKTIEALKATWAAPAAPAVSAVVPADTSAVRSGPKETSENTTPPDDKSIYEELLLTNPVLASRFALQRGLFEPK